MSSQTVHVAVGVVVDSSQRILIALRPEQLHQGGLWEFPGGKVEASEAVESALGRELKEELGIEVVDSRPLIDIRHDYGDKKVHLDVWWVEQFTGTAHGREGQPVEWVHFKALSDYKFPVANKAIVDAIYTAMSESC